MLRAESREEPAITPGTEGVTGSHISPVHGLGILTRCQAPGRHQAVAPSPGKVPAPFRIPAWPHGQCRDQTRRASALPQRDQQGKTAERRQRQVCYSQRCSGLHKLLLFLSSLREPSPGSVTDPHPAACVKNCKPVWEGREGERTLAGRRH